MISLLHSLGLMNDRDHCGYGCLKRGCLSAFPILMPLIIFTGFIVFVVFKSLSIHPSEAITYHADANIHVVLSTGCHPGQNWQSETLMTSWDRLNHPGKLTRIVSGCANEMEKQIASQTSVKEANFHFTEDYCYIDEIAMGKDFKSKQSYCHLWNKPMGMWSFLNATEDEDTIIILMDPDQILTKPFDVHLKSSEYSFVQEGHPVHQLYGYGSGWLEWDYCEGPNCEITHHDAGKHLSVGPPYMMHINDWKKLAPLWPKYSKKCRPQDYNENGIMYEMYGFSYASLHLGFRPTAVRMMVSNVNAHEEWVAGFNDQDLTIDAPPVPIFHYCSGLYINGFEESSPRQGGFNFHKGHVPKNILTECDMPLLAEVPTGPKAVARDKHPQKRNIFMTHWLIKYINLAVTSYRNKYCPDGWNRTKTVFMHQPDFNKGYYYIPGEKPRWSLQGYVPWEEHNPPVED